MRVDPLAAQRVAANTVAGFLESFPDSPHLEQMWDDNPDLDVLSYAQAREGCPSHDQSTLRPLSTGRAAPAPVTQHWQDIAPEDAMDLDLSVRLDITAPLNEMGERCPWPWDPQQLKGAPLGMYHCRYCGAMVLAGIEHVDYTNWDSDVPPEPS